jgi:hypothetical protein
MKRAISSELARRKGMRRNAVHLAHLRQPSLTLSRMTTHTHTHSLSLSPSLKHTSVGGPADGAFGEIESSGGPF